MQIVKNAGKTNLRMISEFETKEKLQTVPTAYTWPYVGGSSSNALVQAAAGLQYMNYGLGYLPIVNPALYPMTSDPSSLFVRSLPSKATEVKKRRLTDDSSAQPANKKTATEELKTVAGTSTIGHLPDQTLLSQYWPQVLGPAIQTYSFFGN